MPARLRTAAALGAALLTLAACTSTTAPRHTPAPRSSAAATTSVPDAGPRVPPTTAGTPTHSPRERGTDHPAPPRATRPAPTSTHPPTTTHPKTPPQLPVRGATGDAAQLLTVSATSMSTTRATLQAWHRTMSGWARTGPAVPAFLGSAGLTDHMSEATSSTPVGSFTLTQAFGRKADPGTRLPYFHTTPADWWISQIGNPDYNTHQRCSSDCSFRQGSPNEHLYYETPYYDYVVVIDYNTRNAPGGVRQGGGSAIFLHVSVGAPTAGCVSIDRADLVRIMRWLRPADHPRILIGLQR